MLLKCQLFYSLEPKPTSVHGYAQILCWSMQLKFRIFISFSSSASSSSSSSSTSYFLDIRNNTYLTSIAECVLDLNYVVDSSSSINFLDENNYGLMLQFIANVSNFFTIGPKDTQVAFVLCSTVANVEWGLTRYRNKTSLINTILNVPYIGGQTNLNDALRLTWSNVFAPGRGTRPNASKVTVILIDGVDNVPTRGTPLTLQNAARCKNDRIRLIAVGLSNRIDRNRLMQIVSSPSDFYPVNDFTALQSIVADLTQQICAKPAITSIVTHSTYKRQNNKNVILLCNISHMSMSPSSQRTPLECCCVHNAPPVVKNSCFLHVDARPMFCWPRSASTAGSQVWLGLPNGRFQSGGSLRIVVSCGHYVQRAADVCQ